jgi:hypothetical protein
MYCNANTVRELTPLLTTEAITDTKIRDFIRRAESKLNLHLGRRYVVPIVKNDNLTGTISISAGSTTINGSGTDFSNEIAVGDYIYPLTTKEAMKVTAVGGTALTVSANAVNAVSSSSYFVLPPEIVTASEYLSAKLIVQTYFSEQGYNQETSTFDSVYNEVAMDIINSICGNSILERKPSEIRSDYFNTDLQTQSTGNNNARLVYINNTNAARQRVDEFSANLTSSDFYL